ncbi:MAG: hypothetical protein AAGC46_12255 [Solirubrobacteraceae bacterium]|nr:hypothetical protein [Patulibacter sp.]
MRGAGTPAVAALIAVVVLLSSLLGFVDVPSKAYLGLLLLLTGLAALAWGAEEDE